MTTTAEGGLAQATDEAQLDYALATSRAFVTHADFLRICEVRPVFLHGFAIIFKIHA